MMISGLKAAGGHLPGLNGFGWTFFLVRFSIQKRYTGKFPQSIFDCLV